MVSADYCHRYMLLLNTRILLCLVTPDLKFSSKFYEAPYTQNYLQALGVVLFIVSSLCASWLVADRLGD